MTFDPIFAMAITTLSAGVIIAGWQLASLNRDERNPARARVEGDRDRRQRPRS